MNRVIATREPWHSLPRDEREAILLALQDVLASPHFCNSKRYPALLQYIVEKTLAGEADQLKERTLGVEVFDRSASYDTNADTVVRYTAGEVRKRLSLYYHELGGKPKIRISLPAGSYVPEFFQEQDVQEEPGAGHGTLATHVASPGLLDDIEGERGQSVLPLLAPLPGSRVGVRGATQTSIHSRHVWWATLAVAAVVIALTGFGWRYRAVHPKTPIDSFWSPVVRDQSAMMVCVGGSVFSQTHLSGVATATKDVDYPFISIQSASAIAEISQLLERSGGAATLLQGAATTPLTELKEHPVILLGGYNNQWTLRLLQPLRFHFTPETVAESIVDEEHSGVVWRRDPSLPYSNADDYAIMARFRDPTTDNWVVALAGVGRNGTEAAAEFATSAHYMQMLRDQVGTDFTNRNVEAVLKVNVIDGKTGAPSILAAHVW